MHWARSGPTLTKYTPIIILTATLVKIVQGGCSPACDGLCYDDGTEECEKCDCEPEVDPVCEECIEEEMEATDKPQKIKSPNYPSDYVNGLMCLYRITAPEGRIIGVSFPAVDLVETNGNKCKDYVAIDLGGEDVAENPVMCAGDEPGTFFSISNSMNIYFRTDGCHTAKGMEFEYVLVEDNDEDEKELAGEEYDTNGNFASKILEAIFG